MEKINYYNMKIFKSISIKKISTIYEKTGCNMSATAKALKVARKTLYEWRNNYDELREAMEDIEEGLLDFAESKLIKQIQEDSLDAIKFFLKNKGKSRGYCEKVETEVQLNAFEKLMMELPDELE